MLRRAGVCGWLILSALAARAETFTDTGSPLTGVRVCSVEWGDYDGDGDLDLLFAGYETTDWITAVADYEGGTFTETDVLLPGMNYGSVGWGDYDGDGDLDAFISGSSETGYITCVYANDGSGFFSDVGAGMPGHSHCSAAWGDYDNDGDPDLAVAGLRSSPSPTVCTIFRNEGDGSFTDIEAGMEPVYNCSVAWGDYDSDGDLDLLVAGRTDAAVDLCRIYSNTDGAFQDAQVTGLDAVDLCAVGWADYDNDGDLDLAVCGRRSGVPSSRVYENQGGSFVLHADLTGVRGSFFVSSLAWGDYDANGYSDLVIAGKKNGSSACTVYQNNAGTFSVEQELQGVYDCSVGWGDYDSDGDLDLAVAGETGSGNVTLIYQCNVIEANTAPTAPGTPSDLVDDQDVTLSWTASTDTETPQLGLTYNLRVGTAPGADDIMSSMSDPATGRRLVAAPGNVWQNLSWTLRQLSEGSYHWAVQAVDAGYVASAWAEGASFDIFDTTPPTILLPTDPDDGETDVATTRVIRITFSEPMNRSAVEAAFSTSPSVSWSPSWSGNVLSITAALEDNTGYTVTVGTGAVDLADNPIGAPFSFWFTTPDETSPTVDSTSPGGGATDVDPSQPIAVTFSEPMDAGSVGSFSINPDVTMNFSWDGTKTTMFAQPAVGDLADETLYEVTIDTTAKDASGNNLAADYVFSFTTGDYTAPAKPGSFTADDRDTDWISLSWDLTEAQTSPDFQGIVILRSDVSSPSYLPSHGETLTVSQSYGGALCVYSGAGTSFVDTGLSPSTHYYYAARSFDAEPNYSSSALAEDETAWEAPDVVSTGPLDGAGDVAPGSTIEVTFSEAMNQAATEGAFSVSPAVAGVFSWNGDTLVFTPDESLASAQAYAVTIGTGASDLDGHGLAAEYAFSFTVVEYPEVVSTAPQDGAGDAAPGTTVEVTFSEPMNLTATENDFSVSPAVAGSVSWNAETFAFTPDEPLVVDQTYTVTIGTGACDLDGHGLVADFGFSFTVSESSSGGGGCGAQVAVALIVALFLRRRS